MSSAARAAARRVRGDHGRGSTPAGSGKHAGRPRERTRSRPDSPTPPQVSKKRSMSGDGDGGRKAAPSMTMRRVDLRAWTYLARQRDLVFWLHRILGHDLGARRRAGRREGRRADAVGRRHSTLCGGCCGGFFRGPELFLSHATLDNPKQNAKRRHGVGDGLPAVHPRRLRAVRRGERAGAGLGAVVPRRAVGAPVPRGERDARHRRAVGGVQDPRGRAGAGDGHPRDAAARQRAEVCALPHGGYL